MSVDEAGSESQAAVADALDVASQSWREAAARLTQSLGSTYDESLRLALLKRLAKRFGELGYPGFLKLLLVIAESDDVQAQQQLADALALGLSRVDVPSGELTSWGGSSAWPALQSPELQSLDAHTLSHLADARAPRRQLGPIEYLTVWYCQRTQRPYLSEDAYREALAKLVALIDRNPQARELYPLRIESDIVNGREGSYTRQTRDRLLALAAAWRAGHDAEQIAQAASNAGARPLDPTQQRLLRDL